MMRVCTKDIWLSNVYNVANTLIEAATVDNLWSVKIGIAIRTLRDRAGMTQLQLAERAGMDQGNLSRLERGKGDLPTERLVAIAHALGLKASAILEYAEIGDDAGRARWLALYDALTPAQRETMMELLHGPPAASPPKRAENG
jgi:transcriptional regulator with XRE-family HTH domain